MFDDNLSKLDRMGVRQCLFHPRKDLSGQLPPGVREYMVTVEPGVEVGIRWHEMPEDGAPSILFFHGNGEIAGDYDGIGPVYNSFGLGFIVADYRGYGKSTGEPTVRSLVQDAHIIFHYVRHLAGGRGGTLAVMGRSLGSVSALEIAASYGDQITAVILDSAFASTVGLLGRMGLSAAELKTDDEGSPINIRNIARITKPTLLIHGALDRLVPLSEAEVLMSYSGARKKQLIVVPGADHNSIMEICGETYIRAIRDFLLGTRRKRLSDKS